MFGVRRFHAVINPPQAAILAVGEVAPRAVVAESGELVARRTMEVGLSCDHRLVYGAEAARFLQRVRHLLEHPSYWSSLGVAWPRSSSGKPSAARSTRSSSTTSA